MEHEDKTPAVDSAEKENEYIDLFPAEGREATAVSLKPEHLIRELRQRGYGKEEAGNIAASMFGLKPDVSKPWTAKQISEALFNKWLVEQGRIAQDDTSDL